MKFFALIALALASVSTPLMAAESDLFKAQTIDDKIQIGYGLAVADVNGDKKPDILLVDKAEVVWYENPSWSKHVIAKKLTELDHVCIAARDIDGDGKAEIAVGAGWNPGDTLKSGAVFYLAAPEDRTQLWKPIQLKHLPTVHRMWWVKSEDAISLMMLPLHGVGNKNGEGEPVKMLEYTKPSDPSADWKVTEHDTGLHMTHNFDPVEWDKNEGSEMLVGGKENILLYTHGNGDWRKRELIPNLQETGFKGAGEVRLAQIGGKRMIATIEPMHGNEVAVYRYVSRRTWSRQLLDSSLVEGHALGCGDLLHKGYDQIVAGWRGTKGQTKPGLKLFVPKDKTAMEWEQVIIDDGGMACEDLKVADLDGDGALDIIAAGRATKNVKIYWNKAGKG